MNPSTRASAVTQLFRKDMQTAKQYRAVTRPICTLNDGNILYHTKHLTFCCPSSEMDSKALQVTAPINSDLLQKLLLYISRVTEPGKPIELPSVSILRHERSTLLKGSADESGSDVIIEISGREYRYIDLIYACRVLGAVTDTEAWTLRPDGILTLTRGGSRAAVIPMK